MPSVVGLLEQRECAARRRVDELREEADRIQAELAVAERDWNEWVVACSRVGEVLAPGDGGVAGLRAMYKIASTICRRGCFSRRPPLEPVRGEGSNGSTRAHCSSVRSDG